MPCNAPTEGVLARTSIREAARRGFDRPELAAGSAFSKMRRLTVLCRTGQSAAREMRSRRFSGKCRAA